MKHAWIHLIALLLAGLVNVPVVNATLWTVQMGGSPLTPSEPPYYSPQFLTIEVGDQVRWSNQSGIHSVNGSLTTFPGNPEGFFSGLPQGGAWTWSFTFTIPGVYDYHCDGDGHAATQFGTITVLDPTGTVNMRSAGDEVLLYPSPAHESLRVELNGFDARTLSVVALNGETVMSHAVNAMRPITMDVSGLRPASYFVLITDQQGRMMAKPFTRQ